MELNEVQLYNGYILHCKIKSQLLIFIIFSFRIFLFEEILFIPGISYIFFILYKCCSTFLEPNWKPVFLCYPKIVSTC